MDGNIDTVREALDRLKSFTHHAADSQDSEDIKTVCAALSAIDPETIRRECAEKICALDAKLPAMRRSSYQEGYGDALDDAEAAILSAEPARDDGKPEIGLQIEAWVWPSGEWKIRGASKDAWKEHGAFQIVQITLGAEVKRRLVEACAESARAAIANAEATPCD